MMGLLVERGFQDSYRCSAGAPILSSPRPPIEVAIQKENGTEVINRDDPPKLARFFVPMKHTASVPCVCLSGARREYRAEKKDDREGQKTYL